MIIGGILTHICFWVGAYTITTKVVYPALKKVEKTINELKTKNSINTNDK